MIRFGKRTVSAKYLIAAFLLSALLLPLFLTNLASTVEAAVTSPTAGSIPTDIPANRIIYVCGYDEGIYDRSTDKTINGSWGDNPSVSLYWGNARRFHTLAEAFWYIHSGGYGIDADNYDKQAEYRAADWVIIVRGIQQFIHNSNGYLPDGSRVARGLNFCYEETDGTISFGIAGRYSFSEPKGSAERPTDVENYNGTWDQWGRNNNADYATNDSFPLEVNWATKSSEGNALHYEHTGTWYITGAYKGTNYLTEKTNDGKTVGSYIYFNLKNSLYFSTGGPIHFSNINLISNKNVHFYSEEGFSAGENVSTPDYTYVSGDSKLGNNKYLFSVYAGPAFSSTLSKDCKIILDSGNWRTIMAGGNRGNITGNVTVALNSVAKVYSNVTAGYTNKVTGNVNIYINNSFLPFLYPSPRSGGTVTGTTNIYLMSNSTVLNIQDIVTSATMGAVNITVYNGAHIHNCSATWPNSKFNSGSGVTATLNLDGYQGGFGESVSLAGFDNITLSNSAKVSYRKTFLSGSKLTINSGCMLYLSNYASSADLPSMTLSNSGTIRYALVYYVDQSAKPSNVTYKYLDDFKASSEESGSLTIGNDGYTTDTAFNTLTAAYAAADGQTLKVNCEFIVCGNTSEPSALTAGYYGSQLPSRTVTISSINGATLTLPSGSGFGFTTVLENVKITVGSPYYLFTGQYFTANSGTTFTNGTNLNLVSGYYVPAKDLSYSSDTSITLNYGTVGSVYLGNDYHNLGDVIMKINGDAYTARVYCGASQTTGNIRLNVVGTAAGPSTGAYNLGYVFTTPCSANGKVNGNVIIQLIRGAMYGDVKLYGDKYDSVNTTANSGSVTGYIAVNLADEFVYNHSSMFYNANTADADFKTQRAKVGGNIILNLAGWTRNITANDVRLMSYINTLGAISETYNNVTTTTNAVCYETLPSNLITNASNTDTYNDHIYHNDGNYLNFHNANYRSYSFRTADRTSGQVYFGHQFPSGYVTAADPATSLNDIGWVEYGTCSLCGSIFASSDDGSVTYIDSANANTSCTLESCYRYYYAVNVNVSTNDGGAGGTVNFTSYGADERNFSATSVATPSTYYSFDKWTASGFSQTGTSLTYSVATIKSYVGNKGGTIYMTANFTRNKSDLTITRSNAADTSQVFVYKVAYDTSRQGTEAAGPTLYLTVTGNGSVKISGLPQGVYTVTQQNDWSWRYNNRTNETNSITLSSNVTTTFAKTSSTANYSYNTKWLDCNTTVTRK